MTYTPLVTFDDLFQVRPENVQRLARSLNIQHENKRHHNREWNVDSHE